MKGIALKELNSSVFIGSGALSRVSEAVKGCGKVALVYSKNLGEKAEKNLFAALNECNLYSFKLSDGEATKNVEWACLITEFLAVNGFNRGDVIVAAGGGTVCDLCGFIASVYMRGIKYVNVPTTLLCAVDACIGGKTAVDIPHVKNGWGTFYQPALTAVDVDIIAETSGDAFYGGVSEIVKYGVLNPEFFDYLDNFTCADDLRLDLENVIYKCLKIKADFVSSDVCDFGIRKKLNAGHTVAHAIEQASGYKITHGEAVAKGLFSESAAAYIIGELSESAFNRIVSALKRLVKGFCPQRGVSELIPFMRLDKKNETGSIAFALPTNSGVQIFNFSEQRLKTILR